MQIFSLRTFKLLIVVALTPFVAAFAVINSPINIGEMEMSPFDFIIESDLQPEVEEAESEFLKHHCHCKENIPNILNLNNEANQALVIYYNSMSSNNSYLGVLADLLINFNSGIIEGAFYGNLYAISLSVDAFITVLRQLEVDESTLTTISDLMLEFAEIQLDYAACVTTQNQELSGTPCDQQDLNTTFRSTASQLGKIFQKLSGSETLFTIQQEIATLEEQQIQAYNGVLIEEGVNPGNPLFEGLAATFLGLEIQIKAQALATILVLGITEKTFCKH